MPWKVHTALLEEDAETNLLEEYGFCCELPCLVAVYSIENTIEDDVDIQKGFFISYSCLVCGSSLYTTDIGHSPYKWV